VNDSELIDLFEQCSNRGRWGDDDELGTLNHITDEKRRAAAALVRTGRALSIGRDLSTVQSSNNPRPVVHMMTYEQHSPLSALDFFGVATHGFAVTHLDAISHVYWEDNVYNGRRAGDVALPSGMAYGSIHAQRQGIFTRGVLLDVAAARGVPWLEPTEFVTVSDLEAAEKLAGVRVETGDAVFVRVGLEAREGEQGPEDLSQRAGLDAEVLPWLHEREVAVYSGDCVERIPYPSTRVPLPLHQIGLVAMGLVLLDCPHMEDLASTCAELDTNEFLLTVAPLRLPGGTGSPVNPICLF
jgi:kynurenine formamidase